MAGGGLNMGSITNTVYDIATWLIPLAIAIVFHEVAHGRVAQFFGDNTARDAGRLSLNPIRHIDPIGTIILPMFLAITHLPIFGWAKPVPVVSARLRNPRWPGFKHHPRADGRRVDWAVLSDVRRKFWSRARFCDDQFEQFHRYQLVSCAV
jgi:hypothetical protein